MATNYGYEDAPGLAPQANTGNMSWSIFDKNVRKMTAPSRHGGVYGAGGSNVRELMGGYNDRKAKQAQVKNDYAVNQAKIAAQRAATRAQFEAARMASDTSRANAMTSASTSRTNAMLSAETQKELAAMQDKANREALEKQYGFKDVELAALTDYRNKGLSEQEAAREAMYGFKESELAALADYRNRGFEEQVADRERLSQQWQDQFGLNKKEADLAAAEAERRAKMEAERWNWEQQDRANAENNPYGGSYGASSGTRSGGGMSPGGYPMTYAEIERAKAQAKIDDRDARSKATVAELEAYKQGITNQTNQALDQVRNTGQYTQTPYAESSFVRSPEYRAAMEYYNTNKGRGDTAYSNSQKALSDADKKNAYDRNMLYYKDLLQNPNLTDAQRNDIYAKMEDLQY